MAKRSKKTMASNIKNHFSASSRKIDPGKVTEHNARAVEQIGNVMNMIKDVLSGQEDMFSELIEILKIIPETSVGRERQANLVTKKVIDTILKIEKQIEKEQDPEKKKKLQGAVDVLKTQGASTYTMARPQKQPSSFSEMLQYAIFGVSPERKQQAGGFLPAAGQAAKDKLTLAKMMFGVFPKQKTGAEGFEKLLETGRKKVAGQEKIESASSLIEKIIKTTTETEKVKEKKENKTEKAKEKKVVAATTSKDTLDFYDNVLEGLNLVVMNQDRTNELLTNITPAENDRGTTSPNITTAEAIPDTPPKTADDLISGYGDRVLKTAAGSYALNNEDDIIAGTNLLPKGSVKLGSLASSGKNDSRLLSMGNRTNADDLVSTPAASSNSTTVINNVDNSTVATSTGGGGGSASVVYIRDVHNSHVRFQEKRLTSLLA